MGEKEEGVKCEIRGQSFMAVEIFCPPRCENLITIINSANRLAQYHTFSYQNLYLIYQLIWESLIWPLSPGNVKSATPILTNGTLKDRMGPCAST